MLIRFKQKLNTETNKKKDRQTDTNYLPLSGIKIPTGLQESSLVLAREVHLNQLW